MSLSHTHTTIPALHRSVRSYACLCLLSVSRCCNLKAKDRRWSPRRRKRLNQASYLQHRLRRRQKELAVSQLQLDVDQLELRGKAWTRIVKAALLERVVASIFVMLVLKHIFNDAYGGMINLAFPPSMFVFYVLGGTMKSFVTWLLICWEKMYLIENQRLQQSPTDWGEPLIHIELHQQMSYLTLNWYYHHTKSSLCAVRLRHFALPAA